jgi:RHS repeat-associated protein
MNASSAENRFKFTGHERDGESGLDHAWFRQYASKTGRWMTPDPGGLAVVDPFNPQTWNRYAYVLNDPINLRDPSGLGVECITTSIDGQLTSGGCRWVDSGEGWAGTGDDLFSLYPILGIPNNTPVDEAYLAWLDRDAYAELLRDYWAQQHSGTTPSAQSQPTPQSKPYDPPVEKDFFHNNASCPKCGNLWNSAASWGNAAAGATLFLIALPTFGAIGSGEFGVTASNIAREVYYSPKAADFAIDALHGYPLGTPPATWGGLAGFGASQVVDRLALWLSSRN